MKGRKNILFVAVVSAIYAVAFFSFVLPLAFEFNNGKNFRSESRFNIITRDFTRISKNYPVKSKDFYDELLASLGNVSDIAGIQLKYGNELIFSYPRDVASEGDVNGPLVKNFNTFVNVDEDISLELLASIYLLKPSSIFYKARASFFVMLGTTIFVLLYILFSPVPCAYREEKENDVHDLKKDDSESNSEFGAGQNDDVGEMTVVDDAELEMNDVENAVSESSDENGSQESLENPSAVDEEKQQDEKDPFADDDPFAEEKDPFADDEDSFADKKDESDELKTAEITDTEMSALQSELKKVKNDSEDEDVLAFLNDEKEKDEVDAAENDVRDDADAPKGLYNPDTGFGWEEYLIKRLDGELVRAASGEQDLSIFTLRIPEIDWKSDSGKAVSEHIRHIARLADLVFDYNEDGATIVLPGLNTDQALVMAETVHSELKKIISDKGLDYPVAIGISTRSLRLISASRLANESQEALKRAMEDLDSPIIAFRVDPAKYKDFLASELLGTSVDEAKKDV